MTEQVAAKEGFFRDARLREEARNQHAQPGTSATDAPVTYANTGTIDTSIRPATGGGDEALRLGTAEPQRSGSAAHVPTEEHPLDRDERRHNQPAHDEPRLPAIARERRGRPVKQTEDHDQPEQQPQPRGQVMNMNGCGIRSRAAFRFMT